MSLALGEGEFLYGIQLRNEQRFRAGGQGVSPADVADCLGWPLSALQRELTLAVTALRARLRSRGLHGAAWLSVQALLRELRAPEPRTGFLQDLMALWETRDGPSAR